MSSVVTVALPLFAMILVGYLAVKRGVLTAEATKGLISIVFWLFLPCFIFTKVVDLDMRATASALIVLIPYYTAATLIFVVAVVSGMVFWRCDTKAAVLRGFASISGVVGYMGLPLVPAVLGPSATLPVIVLVTADNLVILALGSLGMELIQNRDKSGGFSALQFFKTLFVATLKNPLFLSSAAALIVTLQAWKLPGPLNFFAQQFTAATGPCALVALGAALASHSKRDSTVERSGDVVSLVVLKTILFPLLVLVTTKFVFALPEVVIHATVIMAALPVAVNVFVMAARYGAYVEQASRAMLLSTLVSIVIISGLLIWRTG